MSIKNRIIFFLFLLTSSIVLAQTPGFNYQALILSNEQIQIPGTDVTNPNQPLISEEIIIRFTILTDEKTEYIEEQNVFTDEFGMISLIVGDGTPINSNFEDINWDGKAKYLKVELKILSKKEDYLLIDNQKILHIPNPNNNTGSGYGNIKIVDYVNEISEPYNTGDLVWVKNYGINANTTLIIWNGKSWIPVNEDYDAENEFGLIVVRDNSSRNASNPNPNIGDVVWNQVCKCIQIYDNNSWLSITTNATNGITLKNGSIKLGGALTEATIIETNNTNTLAIKGLENDSNKNNNVVVIDKKTGILKQTPIESIISTQSKELVVYANDGQLEFKTPLNITSTDKINVYRNGINISFTIKDIKTIKLEPEAICYKNDKIRIVQLF